MRPLLQLRRVGRAALASGAGLLFASALLASAARAHHVASESWNQFQGGPGHAGWAPNGPGPGFAETWTASTEPGGPRDAYGLSAPVAWEDLVIAAGPEEVVAFDLTDGSAAWSVERVLGPSVPPAIVQTEDGPLVVFTEGWGEGPPDADVSATPGTSAPTATPTASASPGSPEGEGVSRLVAVSATDQEEAWSLDLPGVSRTGVTTDGVTVYVGTIDGSVLAVDPTDGSMRWTAQPGGYFDTPIVLQGQAVIAAGRGDREAVGSLVALGATDGAELWRYEAPRATLAGTPSAANGSVYLPVSDGTIRAIDAATGQERWSARLNAPVLNGAAAVGDDVLVAADGRGQVYLLDAATGERRWDHALNVPVLRTSPVVSGDVALVGTRDGDLVAFALDTGNMVWRGRMADGPIRGLAVSGQTLIAARAGVTVGLIAMEHDPAAELVDIASPTLLDAPRMLGYWALAAVPLSAALLLLGRALWARMGLPDFPEDEEEDEAP